MKKGQRPDISFIWGYYILSISSPKKRILYPITITAKKGYGYISYILCHKNWYWLKLAKIGKTWPIFKLFSFFFTFFRSWNTPQTVLERFYEVQITFWKKLVEEGTMTYLFFDIFGICMLWGIQNQLRGFFASTFGSTSPSAWCVPPGHCALWQAPRRDS
jgi:hypothetical protein